jgi:hypothetical protein
MRFQLTSLRYSQGAPAKKQTHFYWKFKGDEISAQDRIILHLSNYGQKKVHE